MTTNDDRFNPSWDGSGDTLEDDGFTEDGSSKDITDLVDVLNVSVVLQHDGEKGRERTVPFGLFHISLSLNSSTRASSGVIVAHLIPTLYF